MYIKSPMNYTGGKYRLLPQIMPMMPKQCSVYVDMFTGGANVAVNIEADRIIANDKEPHVIDIYKYMQNTNIQTILSEIKYYIEKYNLSKTNTEGYNALRKDYNSNQTPIKLYTLICYAYNHQIRYNRNNQYNISFGQNRSAYNQTIENNLKAFVKGIQTKKVEFCNYDFAGTEMQNILNQLNEYDYVYADPPYLISLAGYNEKNAWTEKEDSLLMDILDKLDSRGVKWGMSNVLTHKGMTNKPLTQWAQQYTIVDINYNYRNCNYHSHHKEGYTREVFIKNY